MIWGVFSIESCELPAGGRRKTFWYALCYAFMRTKTTHKNPVTLYLTTSIFEYHKAITHMLGTELLFWLAKVLIFIYFKIPETYLCLCVCMCACMPMCKRERDL